MITNNPTPINKKPQRVITLALILGLMLGFVAVIISQSVSLDGVTEQDIHDLNMLFWGTLPARDSKFDQAGKFTLTADYDDYSLLRTRMLLDVRSRDKIFSTMDLTSQNSKLILPRLAAALANIDYRAIIIDADFRNSEYMEKFPGVGLRDLLTGEANVEDIESIIIPSETFPNIHFLKSGGQVDTPSDLLASRTLPILLKNLRKFYNFVFILSPTNFNVSDPFILAGEADKTVFFMDPTKLEKEKLAEDLLKLRKFNKHNAAVFYTVHDKKK